jgi:malate dehydrogenase (oxaloacetate-decarboxylating)
MSIGSYDNNIILRLEIQPEIIQFGQIITFINEQRGDIVAIDMIQVGRKSTVRDVTVTAPDAESSGAIIKDIGGLPGVKLLKVSDRTFLLHLGGKIEMKPKVSIANRDDLSRVYTPDVARVSMAIKEEPQKAYSLTIKRNTVAVVSDGSAVLGLGNIGPYAAMPVMEGKAMLFKQFADIDSFPICLDTQDTEQIIACVKQIAPAFGGINLEDISSPRCFEIEERLRRELDIPVFHDDQHGTAVVLYAGLINALKLVGKSIDSVKIVVCGVGAAGISCTRMLLKAGARHIIGVDRGGALVPGVVYDNPAWNRYVETTNPDKLQGSLSTVIAGADVFIGLSTGGVLTREDVLSMSSSPIVFAMANPSPEIDPFEIEDMVGVVATGRSDYPNQINNVLCFPGIFRGALDCQAKEINEEMKLAAAEAIAEVISPKELNKLYIIPSVFNPDIVKRIRKKVIEAALRSGVARRVPREFESER